MHDPFYMYASTWHWQPLVNATADTTPRYIDLDQGAEDVPSPEATVALTEMGVQAGLVHEGLYPPAST